MKTTYKKKVSEWTIITFAFQIFFEKNVSVPLIFSCYTINQNVLETLTSIPAGRSQHEPFSMF